MLPPVLIQGDRFNIRKKKIAGWIKGAIHVISGTIAPGKLSQKPLKDTKTQSFFQACQGYARQTKKGLLGVFAVHCFFAVCDSLNLCTS